MPFPQRDTRHTGGIQDQHMRAVVQRVRESRVTVGEKVTGEIGKGLMVLIGVEAVSYTHLKPENRIYNELSL